MGSFIANFLEGVSSVPVGLNNFRSVFEEDMDKSTESPFSDSECVSARNIYQLDSTFSSPIHHCVE